MIREVRGHEVNMGGSPFPDGTAALRNRLLSDMPALRNLQLIATLAALALLTGGPALTHPALGQARERGYERHDERRGHEVRNERRFDRDRDRRWRGRDYGYDVPSYGVAPPPLVYSPPPPPPGINFLFSFR
jgi:hypothetical protein